MDLKTQDREEKLDFIEKYENTIIDLEEKVEVLEEFKKDSEKVFQALMKFLDRLEGKS